MKTIVVSVLMWAFCCSSSCLAQASKKIVQLHQLPSNIVHLHLQLPSNKIKIIKTKSSRVSVETTIHLDAGSSPLLDYLIKSGRYNLGAAVDPNQSSMALSLPTPSKTLIIKGAICEEHISYIIHVPERLLKVTTSYNSLTASLSE